MTNTAYGSGALANITTGEYNSAFGHNAVTNLTTGLHNTGLGAFALRFLVAGDYNTAVGQSSLVNATGSQNSALGKSAGASLTTASKCVFIGMEAGYHPSQKVDATNAVAVGFKSYTTKSDQAVFGNSFTTETVLFGDLWGGREGATRVFDDYGSNNIFIGGAGPADTTTVAATGALGIGPGALAECTSGGNPIAIGIDALRKNTGNDHTAVGNEALKECSGSGTVGNTAVGRRALGKTVSGAASTAVGDTAAYESLGDNIDAFGYGAAWKNTDGDFICAFGTYAGAGYGLSSRWVAIGTEAMSNPSGLPDTWDTNVDTISDNVAVGYRALFETLGKESVAVGSEAHRNYTGTGGRLTGVGFRAGQRLTAGHSCTFLGWQAGENENQKVDAVNSTALGANSYTTRDNQVSLGSDGTVETVIRGIQRGTAYAVAELPSPTTSGVGARAFVTDADAPAFGTPVTGGGSVAVPVYSDGVSWLVG